VVGGGCWFRCGRSWLCCRRGLSGGGCGECGWRESGKESD
jgi:hypothetical protein